MATDQDDQSYGPGRRIVLRQTSRILRSEGYLWLTSIVKGFLLSKGLVSELGRVSLGGRSGLAAAHAQTHDRVSKVITGGRSLGVTVLFSLGT
jgi:hypothetical protein